jgi:hypothetical protein
MRQKPYIVHYTNIALGNNGTNLYESYWYINANRANPELNILSSAIPSAYGTGFYTISVYDSGGNVLTANGGYPWVLDTDAGILKFFTMLTSANSPPKISFYRYEGRFGLPSSFTNLYASTINISSIVLQDLYKNIPGTLTLSNDSLYFFFGYNKNKS